MLPKGNLLLGDGRDVHRGSRQAMGGIVWYSVARAVRQGEDPVVVMAEEVAPACHGD